MLATVRWDTRSLERNNMLGVIVGPHATHDYVGAPTPRLDYFVRPITRLVRHTHHDIVRGIGLGALDKLVSPVCLLEHEDKRRPRRRRTGLPDDGLATASIYGGDINAVPLVLHTKPRPPLLATSCPEASGNRFDKI